MEGELSREELQQQSDVAARQQMAQEESGTPMNPADQAQNEQQGQTTNPTQDPGVGPAASSARDPAANNQSEDEDNR